MRALVLFAALSVTAPTPAEEFAANSRWCVSANTQPAHRIVACSRLIGSGRLTRSKLADVYYYRGNAYGDQRRREQAIADYSEAVRLSPDLANAFHDRGMAHEDLRHYRRAKRDYDSAIRLEPDFASALNSKAWLLSTAPEGAVRDGVEAIRLAERALLLVSYPEHRDTLAAAYAEAGRFAEAVTMQETAIFRLNATGRVLLLPAYRARLDLYRVGRPFHR